MAAFLTAFVAGLIVFVPFPALVYFYVLPAIAWLALVGLCVPAAVFEGGGVGESLRRGYRLGRADYVHSLGSMATLGITFYLATRVMALALNAGSGQAAEIARPVAEGVLWPVVVLGSCLLYFDQVARLESGPRRRRTAMPTYIMLTSLTAQGVQTLKANPDRLREVNRDVEELGAKVVHQWATLGPFDFVNVVEAPDAETIARVSVALGARGSAKLQTLTALSIDQFLGSVS